MAIRFRTATSTLAGLVLRAVVAFAFLGRMPLVSDAQSYSELAASLLSSFPGSDSYYWPPGNSFLLAGVYAIFGASPWVARGLMVVLSTAAIPMTGRLAREVRPESEVPAAWIAAFYPPAVMLVGQSYAQHLAALCLLVFAWNALAGLRTRSVPKLAIAGVALGLGCLTRPSMVSLGLAFLGALLVHLWRAQKSTAAVFRVLAGSACFIALVAALVVPVAMHNANLRAGFTISTNNERNLFLGNNPYTPNYKTSHLGQRPVDDLPPETRDYLRSFYSRADARAAMQREAISYILHHPGTTAYRTLNRTTSFWGFDYLASRIIQENLRWGAKGLAPLLAIEAGGFLAVFALGLIGFIAFGAECEKDWCIWLLSLAAAYEAPYSIAFSGGTYHFPVMGLVMPFAAVAWVGRHELVARVMASKATILALVLLAFVEAEYAYYAIVMA